MLSIHCMTYVHTCIIYLYSLYILKLYVHIYKSASQIYYAERVAGFHGVVRWQPWNIWSFRICQRMRWATVTFPEWPLCLKQPLKLEILFGLTHPFCHLAFMLPTDQSSFSAARRMVLHISQVSWLSRRPEDSESDMLHESHPVGIRFFTKHSTNSKNKKQFKFDKGLQKENFMSWSIS